MTMTVPEFSDTVHRIVNDLPDAQTRLLRALGQGYTVYKRNAAVRLALEERGLITTEGDRAEWNLALTPTGKDVAALLLKQNPPAPVAPRKPGEPFVWKDEVGALKRLAREAADGLHWTEVNVLLDIYIGKELDSWSRDTQRKLSDKGLLTQESGVVKALTRLGRAVIERIYDALKAEDREALPTWMREDGDFRRAQRSWHEAMRIIESRVISESQGELFVDDDLPRPETPDDYRDPDDPPAPVSNGDAAVELAKRLGDMTDDRNHCIEHTKALEARIKELEAKLQAATEKPTEESKADLDKRLKEMSELYTAERAKTVKLEGELEKKQAECSEKARAVFEAERTLAETQRQLGQTRADKEGLARENREQRQRIENSERRYAEIEADWLAAKAASEQLAALEKTAPGQHVVEVGVTAHRLNQLQADGYRVLHYQFGPDHKLDIVALKTKRKDAAYVPSATFRQASEPAVAGQPHA